MGSATGREGNYASDGSVADLVALGADAGERKRFERSRAERAERLLRITGAIADAVSSAEVFEALVDQVAEAVGASSAALWLVDDDARVAKLVRSWGYTHMATQKLEALPLDLSSSLPALDSIRSGQPLWIPSQATLVDGYPHLTPLIEPGRSYRVACLPLVTRGRVLGTLALTMEQAGESSQAEQEFLLLVARYATQAVERLRLFDAERRSRAEADAAARRLVEARARAEQLYRFAQAVVAADRVEAVFDAAIAAIEAALNATRSAVLTFDEDGVMRFRAWRHLSETYRNAVEGHSPWPRDAIAPQPVLVPAPERDPAMAPYLSLFQAEGIGALAFIPIVTRGKLLGKFMVYYDQAHVFASHDVETARAIANHLASVIIRFASVAKLQETIRSNELFAGALAHDLRNPLSAIVIAAQSILMSREGQHDQTDAERRRLGGIVSSGRRMETMIEQLLDFTRARSGGGIDINLANANLAELCTQAVDELELSHPDWKIHRHAIGDPHGTWDPVRLLQVVSNLAANAGQHGAQGERISVKLDGTHPDQVTLEVYNEGAIPESLLPDLFDPFRGSVHQRRQSRGLGLGLFIVREIVRAHGGTVEVSSSPASGTTFAIRLPRHSSPRPQRN